MKAEEKSLVTVAVVFHGVETCAIKKFYLKMLEGGT